MNTNHDLEKANGSDPTMNPVISARAVTTSEDRHGTVIKAPTAPPTMEIIHTHGQVTSTRPQPNRWKDSICDWPNNLFPSCYCACFACNGIWLLAQIAQKVGYTSFVYPIIGIVLVYVIGLVLTIVFGIPEYVVLLPAACAFFFAIGLRLHIAHRDNITENGGCLGEFCCGFWCSPCSIAQMARHVYGYTKVLDGDGDPERPDNYGPSQQV